MDKNRKVVVSGMGVITSVGCSKNEFWESLISGKSGIRRIQSFDPSGIKSQIASEVLDYDPLNYFDRKEARKMARVTQMAVSAGMDAIKDAGMDLDNEDRSRIGGVVSVGGSDYSHLEDQHNRFMNMGPGSISPLTIPRIISNMPQRPGCASYSSR